MAGGSPGGRGPRRSLGEEAGSPRQGEGDEAGIGIVGDPRSSHDAVGTSRDNRLGVGGCSRVEGHDGHSRRRGSDGRGTWNDRGLEEFRVESRHLLDVLMQRMTAENLRLEYRSL